MLILPRQARDKHRESTQKSTVFPIEFLHYQFERKPLHMSDTWANSHPTVVR